MDDSSDLRYAHCDGYTDICFDESSTHLVTCGADGDIRIWNGFDDDDPQSQNMGNIVTAVAIKNKMLFVANDVFSVSAYKFPELEFESIIAQYNSAVYHIVCNSEGNLIASGGGDFITKVYDTLNKSLVAFRGHDGPVLSLAFDTKGKYLASTSCDGTFRIWQLSDQECIKILKILKKSNDRSLTSSQSRLSWSPDGQFIAVPVENEVHLYTRDLWECTFIFKDESIKRNTSIAAFSPFGTYIAAATLDGQIIVWSNEKKTCISRKFHEKKATVCSLAWNPSGKDILFCDIEGQLGLYEEPLTFHQAQLTNVDRKDIPIDFECDDDGDIKDLGDIDANDLELLHDNDDDENAFDIGAIKATLEPKIFGTDDDAAENESLKCEKLEPRVQVIEAPKPLVQSAFQPSSTPVHLERRFMLWNSVGIIRCYNTEEENTIDVEFHDANVHHPLHLNNSRNHTVAALSSEALLMACPKVEENTSKLECLHFGTWDSNKEWIVEMPEDEDIESVALGEGFAVCISDKRLLRIFSISGIQCEVISIPGPVVCIAAKEKQFIVAYHKGLGIENDQCLNLMMVDVKIGGHCLIRDYSLPLSPKSFLSWLGYTDEGHPCVVDSSGIVTILTIKCGTKWIPVANTKKNLKGKSDTYFVLGLSEIKQEIRCIMCKGARYPSLLPRPTVIVLPFSLPFCEMSTDKGLLEEENRRYSLLHNRLEGLLNDGYDLNSEFSSVERKWVEILLKMFALSTRTDREYRALDIAEFMPNTITIQAAIKYATQRHRLALAERLGEVMTKKLLTAQDENEIDPIAEYDSFNTSQSSSYSKSMKLNIDEDTEAVLKPKPLIRSKYDSHRTSGNAESLLSDTNTNFDNLESVSTPKSSPLSNPFKSSSRKSTKDSSSSNIDSLLDNSMKNLNNKSNSSTPVSKPPNKKTKSQEQKTEVQAKLSCFQSEPQAKKYGFQLFLELNRDNILCSSDTEVSEREIIKTGMKMYKELPEAEKQKYAEQKGKEPITNGLSVLSDKTNDLVSENIESEAENANTASTNTNSLKRKENSETEKDVLDPMPKKLKSNAATKPSDSTVRKLTQFAFVRNKTNK